MIVFMDGNITVEILLHVSLLTALSITIAALDVNVTIKYCPSLCYR